MKIDSDVEAAMVLLAFLEKKNAPPLVYVALGWIASDVVEEARERLHGRPLSRKPTTNTG